MEKRKTKEEKEQDKLEQFMEKYQLEDIDESDMVVLKRIANDLVGNSLMKTGMDLSMSKADDKLKITYLSALVEQNWLLIKQLGRLNKNIENKKVPK